MDDTPSMLRVVAISLTEGNDKCLSHCSCCRFCHMITGFLHYCTISTLSSVTCNSHKKSPRFKSLEFKRNFIGYLGQHIFRIRELTVEMVQYLDTTHFDSIALTER